MSQTAKLFGKILASCFIALHVTAVFVAPASVPPTSTFVDNGWNVCSPYLYATNMNNGYHFFAPEPGSSSLLEYVGTTPDGELKHGVLPDKQRLRPRLLYHRYFMLTEFLGSFSDQDPERAKVVSTFAQALLLTEGLDKVELKLVRHRPSTRQEILIGENLESLPTYQRENLGTFSWKDFPSSNR